MIAVAASQGRNVIATRARKRGNPTEHTNQQTRGEPITPQHKTLDQPTAGREELAGTEGETNNGLTDSGALAQSREEMAINCSSDSSVAPSDQGLEVNRQPATAGRIQQVNEAAAYLDRTTRDREIHSVLAEFSKLERAVVAADELCPTTVMRHLVLDRPVVQRSLANNPVFTSQVLGGVVSGFDWRRANDRRNGAESVRLVMHPHCPVELHDFHLEEFCWFDPVRWLLHPALPTDDFEVTLAVGGPGLAMSLIRREEVLAGHLDLIINNSDARIRSAIARLTKDSQALVLLASDSDIRVRQAASRRLLEAL